ncbi:hypothetical protein H0H92_003795 [Tricholoma furcatifolium]|nr:hypothetical protein H0H92_003795 [Tricholoma furcatifolium]
MCGPRLPLDIWDDIVHLVFFDGGPNVKRALSACASAADRELLPRVQRLLFADIRLATTEDFRTLCSLFECNPPLATHIRILRIHEATVEEVDAHIHELTAILGAVSNLRHFEFKFQDRQEFRAWPESFRDTLMARFQTISSLMLSGILDPPLEELMQCQKLQALHIHDTFLLDGRESAWDPNLPPERCGSNELDPHVMHWQVFRPGSIPRSRHLQHVCLDTTSYNFLKPILQRSKHLEILKYRDMFTDRHNLRNLPFKFDFSALRTLTITGIYGLEWHSRLSESRFRSFLFDVVALLEYEGPTLPSTGSPSGVSARPLQTVSLTAFDQLIPGRFAPIFPRIDTALADVDKYPEFMEFALHFITQHPQNWDESVPFNYYSSLVSCMPRLAARGQLSINVTRI